MKSILIRIIPGLLLALWAPFATAAITRSVNIATPTSIAPGQSVSIPISASTSATDGEQIGFFHLDYSTNGGSSWNAVAYDVNVGTAASRVASFTSGGYGSTIVVRVRIAFRGGGAGDVDYNGNAIDWGGSWNNWQVPPTKYAYVGVYGAGAPARSVTISSQNTVAPWQTISIPTAAGTTVADGEGIGFYHLEYSTNGGSSWNAVAYDVNVGSAASRNITLTSGAPGSTIVVRSRIAFRGGGAGDVDFGGSAIDWSGTWDSWQFPPTKYRYIGVGTASYSTPAFEPEYWNDLGTVQWSNNCYNYANNKRTDTFAQPGSASGQQYTVLTVEDVGNAAIRDGLEPTTFEAPAPDGKTKIALAVDSDEDGDYHWFRQDSDGLWTHKPGGSYSTNRDNSGRLIFDPATADRGRYTDFGGYFFTPSDIVQGQGHANIN